jgi:hypothetical protein
MTNLNIIKNKAKNAFFRAAALTVKAATVTAGSYAFSQGATLGGKNIVSAGGSIVQSLQSHIKPPSQ